MTVGRIAPLVGILPLFRTEDLIGSFCVRQKIYLYRTKYGRGRNL
jgi:hypothetical protein